MKIAALDIGNAWTGIALSDASGILGKPYETVSSALLLEKLSCILEKEKVGTLVIGYPKTMQGTISEQTNIIQTWYNHIRQKFPAHTIVLWDERLSSKRSEALKKARTKEEKLASHAIAAAFILASFLDHQAFQKGFQQQDE